MYKRQSYNKNGYITGEVRTEGGKTTESTYAYDALGQLTSFLQSTGYGESYAYDKAGNMLEKAITGTDGQNVTLKMAYNAANQLTGMTNGQSKIAYSYDKNGSLIQKTLTSKTYGKLTDRYAHDALDQLTSYVGYDGYQQQFTYDANGMRLSKKETGDESRSRLKNCFAGILPDCRKSLSRRRRTTRRTCRKNWRGRRRIICTISRRNTIR